LHRVLSLALLFAAACGNASEETPRPKDSAPKSPATVEMIGVKASDVHSTIDSADAKVIVLSFWATSCVPCVKELPHFVALGREWADRGVKVVFVSADFPEDREKAGALLAKLGVVGPSWIKSAQQKDQAFLDGFTPWDGTLPATFVYDEDRHVAAFHAGPMTQAELDTAVRGALSGAAGSD